MLCTFLYDDLLQKNRSSVIVEADSMAASNIVYQSITFKDYSFYVYCYTTQHKLYFADPVERIVAFRKLSNQMGYSKFLIMGHYQRKTDQQSWSQESVTGVIQEVLEGNMGYRRASKAYSVPQTTLERNVKEALDRRKCLLKQQLEKC
ncbi:hypothetical protein AVEN_260069-1 [Araneus ventricosus]|uniref:HTH psq-type domain-containing protein n=1 Tax=Araneus ventricosus TaxID=182803 RepID=A0A4Y2G4Z7_ARAVE|nr:hypothetical protein AVEN_260069-1 [Araneus ventricosus]